MPIVTFTPGEMKKLAKTIPDKPKELRYFQKQGHDRGDPSLMLNVSYSGKLTWHVHYYDNGKPRTKKITTNGGTYPALSVKDARNEVRAFKKTAVVASAKAGSFEKVAEEWFEKKVEKNKFRSANEIRRHLDRYVYPVWAKKRFFDIKRSDVIELLESIAEKSQGRLGTPQADAVLSTIRGVMKWFALRNDEYNSPLVEGMKLDERKSHDKARKRYLDDDEIRAVWAACDNAGPYGGLVQLILLTAQRREKVAQMRHDDLDSGVWTIREDHKREKGHGGTLKLPQLALDIIKKQPVVDGNPYVFPGSARGRRPSKASDKPKPSGPPCFNAWSQRKGELDKLLPKMPPWTHHDLRRTARTLMAGAGVDDKIAEMVLGHTVKNGEVDPAMIRTYDQFNYDKKKGIALQKLSDRIERILRPGTGKNVVSMRKPKAN